MQKTLLIGYLGKDPEMKNTAGGNRYDERDYLLNKCIVFALGQQNLWADSGSGSRPSV
jgi:single-stranded DNA-binding protein